jgi:hypothetical protein
MDEYGSSAGIARNASESEYPDLWRGLVGLWAPSAGHQGQRLIDFAGGTHAYSVSNPTWISGNKLSAKLNGSSDYFNLGKAPKLNIGLGDCSFMARIKVASGYARLLQKSVYGPGSGRYWFGLNTTGRIHIFLSASGGDFDVDVGATSAFGAEAHIAITLKRDGNAIAYLNGRRDGSASIAAVFASGINYSNTFNALFGAYGDATGAGGAQAGTFMAGSFSDVCMYSRVLSPSEIMQSFKGASPLVPLNRPYFNSPTAPPPAGNTANFFRFFR